MIHSAGDGYWSRTKRITGALLALWLLFSLVGPWFARDLDRLLGLKASYAFWIAAQGGLLLYLAIVVVYALVMSRIEARYTDACADPDHEADVGPN